MDDLPEPATFLIPASRYLLKFKAMARLIKLKQAIRRIANPIDPIITMFCISFQTLFPPAYEYKICSFKGNRKSSWFKVVSWFLIRFLILFSTNLLSTLSLSTIQVSQAVAPVSRAQPLSIRNLEKGI